MNCPPVRVVKSLNASALTALFLAVASALASAAAAQAPLWTSRDRVLDLYADRLAVADRCDAWRGMNAVQKGVFLTISHNLWHHYLRYPQREFFTSDNNPCAPPDTRCENGSCPARSEDLNECVTVDPSQCVALGQCYAQNVSRSGPWRERLIDHVDGVYAVLDGGSATGVGSCGGENNNRIFFSLDDPGIFALRNITLGYLPGIRSSADAAGPHDPFTGSRETDHGQPTGQLHYFLRDHETRALAGRRGVGDVFDPFAVEMDIDYNWTHQSNPLCSDYLQKYDREWGAPRGWWPTEYGYQPGGCSGLLLNPRGVVDLATGEGTTAPGRLVRITGAGFDASTEVFFAVDTDQRVGPVGPESVAGGELTVRAPALFGELFVWVQNGEGQRSSTERLRVIESPAVASVNAASFTAGALAPESISSAFGLGLATGIAQAPALPLPTTLAGTTVTLVAAAGARSPARLFFVAPKQVNYLLPAGLAAGEYTLEVRAADGARTRGTIEVTAVAPGLFAAAASGRGPAAGQAFYQPPSGSGRYQPLARFEGNGQLVHVPVLRGGAGEEVFLVLYGTGLRHARSVVATIGGVAAPVVYAGPQGGAGLDQVNLRVPPELFGRGELEARITADGVASNPVTASFG